MAAQVSLTAYDGATTPVSHQFIPEFNDRENGVYTANWREPLSTLPITAQPSVVMTEETRKSGVVVRKIKVMVPVLESATTAGVEGYTAPPKVAFVPTMEITYFSHPRDVVANARNVRMLAINLMGGVSTSVTPNTTDQLAAFIDQGLKPY